MRTYFLLWSCAAVVQSATVVTKQSFAHHNVSVESTVALSNDTNTAELSEVDKKSFFPHGFPGFDRFGSSGFQNNALASGSQFGQGSTAHNQGFGASKQFGNKEATGGKESFGYQNSNSFNQGFGNGAYGGAFSNGGQTQFGSGGQSFGPVAPFGAVPFQPGFGFGGTHYNQLFGAQGNGFGQGSFGYNQGQSSSSGYGNREHFNQKESFGQEHQHGHASGASQGQQGSQFQNGHHNSGHQTFRDTGGFGGPFFG